MAMNTTSNNATATTAQLDPDWMWHVQTDALPTTADDIAMTFITMVIGIVSIMGCYVVIRESFATRKEQVLAWHMVAVAASFALNQI